MSLTAYNSSDHNRVLWARETESNMDTKSIEEYFIKDNYAPIISELPHEAIVFDIGGYIGTYALRIEVERPDLKIFSFEPEPYNYGMMVRNLIFNGSKVVPLQYAISDQNSYIDLTKGDHDGSWSNVFYKDTSNTIITVYAITIVEAMKLVGVDHIDYIKIDVEGAEEIILSSIPYNIIRGLVGIELELHDVGEHQQMRILSNLLRHGFVPNRAWIPIGSKVDLRMNK